MRVRVGGQFLNEEPSMNSRHNHHSHKHARAALSHERTERFALISESGGGHQAQPIINSAPGQALTPRPLPLLPSSHNHHRKKNLPLFPRIKQSPYLALSCPCTYSSVCSMAMFIKLSKQASTPCIGVGERGEKGRMRGCRCCCCCVCRLCKSLNGHAFVDSKPARVVVPLQSQPCRFATHHPPVFPPLLQPSSSSP